MTEACYAITCGSYSDYQVRAIFTTREAAEAALSAYLRDPSDNYCQIEQFPLNPVVPLPPLGMRAFWVQRVQQIFEQPNGTRPIVLCARESTSADVEEKGQDVCADGRITRSTYMFARDKDHAIKIAAERFAQYDAQQAGIS